MASTGVRHPQVTEAPNFQPTLRVMRLFSPKLETTSVLPYCPQADALCSTGTGLTSPFSQRLRPITDESSFALGNSVMLPDNFGAIFLGETFSGYISVVNHLENITLDQVVVQARLACPNSKIEESEARAARGGAPLARASGGGERLGPGQHLERIVERPLGEVGSYHLRVSVAYQPLDAATGRPAGPLETMRKVYRFAVQSPLRLQTRCRAPAAAAGAGAAAAAAGAGPEGAAAADADGAGLPHVEVQVHNAAPALLCVEALDFLPEEGYAADLVAGGPAAAAAGAAAAGGGEGEGEGEGEESLVRMYDRSTMLGQHAAFQAVYRVRRARDGAPPRRPHPAVLEVALGQLNISWTTAMGERGRILSSPIVYKLPPTQDVEVQFEGLQKFVLGQASPIKCKITNRTEKPMHLQIQFRLDAMVGVYIMGKSFRNLGLVSPGQTVVSEAHLMPTVGGLHPFRGVFVVNLDTYQEYDQGIVCDIFVDSPHTRSAPPTISEVVEHELALDLQKTVL